MIVKYKLIFLEIFTLDKTEASDLKFAISFTYFFAAQLLYFLITIGWLVGHFYCAKLLSNNRI